MIRSEARRNADDEADPDQAQAQAQDHPHDMASIAAERNANGNLARLLRHRVSQHPVDAQRDEQDAGAREDPEHQSRGRGGDRSMRNGSRRNRASDCCRS